MLVDISKNPSDSNATPSFIAENDVVANRSNGDD
jgi:hypothetical protein